MQTRFHRSNFRFDGTGDFLERQIFVFGKNQNLSLQRRQRPNGVSDCSGDLAAYDVLDVCRLSDELIVAELFPSLFIAPELERQIARNPQEKRPHGSAARVKVFRLPEQRKKNILRNIFCDGGRTCHSPGEAIDRVLVFVEKSLEFRFCHTRIVTRNRLKGYGSKEEILIAILQRCFKAKTEWMS